MQLEKFYVSIKEMPEDMRPREKMALHGEAAMTDTELLAIILGKGTRQMSALDLARLLLTKHGSLRFIKEAGLEELTIEKGIGITKAITIKAAMEIGRRMAVDTNHKILIKSPEDVKNMVMEEMRYFHREHFRVLYLDRKGGLICMEDISIGSLHSSIVHPREVYKTALKRSAASIILVHNHPSGDPTPSSEDIEVTRRLVDAGRILGIEVLDHIIMGEHSYVSLQSKGLI